VIRLESLSKQFGAQVAVRDLSLEIAEGELLMLVGGSG
jgi:ABC-type Fe3+/spermidine/putrescine transport system ATPase subunit